MKTLRLIPLFFLLGSVSLALAQGPGVQGSLLLIQPSLRANGMAGASVASVETDAIGIALNPARLGLATLTNHFIVEFYSPKTQWAPQLAPDLFCRAKTALLGYNFKQRHRNHPFSFGIGYTRLFWDLGTISISSEADPTIIATFHSTERTHIWTLGVGIDAVVKAGMGWSFKRIESNLAPTISNTAQKGDGRVKANAHDFGLVAALPIDEIISKFVHPSLAIDHYFLRPTFGLGLGYSQSNIGKEIIYIDASQSSALPRVARAGLSLNAGLALSGKKQPWRILSFERLNEAEQLLVRRDSGRNVRYAKFLGDISFGDHVLLGKGGSTIVTKKGWELNVLEILSIRRGRYSDPLGRVNYKTEGSGLSLIGVLKAVQYLNPQLQNSTLLSFLLNHIDVRYNTSQIKAGEGHPLDATEFKGISIKFF